MGALATVVHWHAQKGGETATLQSAIKPLEVAVSSSKSITIPTLKKERKCLESTMLAVLACAGYHRSHCGSAGRTGRTLTSCLIGRSNFRSVVDTGR